MGISDKLARAAGILLVCAAFVSVAGTIVLWRAGMFKAPYAAVAGIFLLAMLAIIAAARRTKHHAVRSARDGIERFGAVLNTGIIRAALAAVYAAGVGPTALLARVFGKEFLSLSVRKDTQSYWEPLDLTLEARERYDELF